MKTEKIVQCVCGAPLRLYFHHHPKKIKRYMCHVCNKRFQENYAGFNEIESPDIDEQAVQELRGVLKRMRM